MFSLFVLGRNAISQNKTKKHNFDQINFLFFLEEKSCFFSFLETYFFVRQITLFLKTYLFCKTSGFFVSTICYIFGEKLGIKSEPSSTVSFWETNATHKNNLSLIRKHTHIYTWQTEAHKHTHTHTHTDTHTHTHTHTNSHTHTNIKNHNHIHRQT